MAGRRRFGKVRKLPSGRYQASYLDPEGIRRPAPETFRTKREADQWLSGTETELVRGQWSNPDDVAELLRDFGNRWIAERSGLRQRTRDMYQWTFRTHIEPQLGKVSLGELDSPRVRRWRADLLNDGVSATMVAKAYRLLRAILMTAVDDGLLSRNPCRIAGAGTEPTPERPVLTVTQVTKLADRMPDRYKALVLVAAFGSLRWSEAIALRRRDVQVEAGAIRIERGLVELSSGALVEGPPKSRAGRRVVALPRPIMAALTEHMDVYTKPGPDAYVFTGVKGGALRRSNFNKVTRWTKTVAVIGANGLHFHDLRHTGNTFAAESGASLRDLMARMGHDSMQAALIYQHRSTRGDRRIADALETMLGTPKPTGDDTPDTAADRQ
ncbi:site-specific integrase [Kineosporia rhizophila]|uniref:tyrosine-type recombinase/integrase n=1 Tax=Kineosporia TaxID=49184 RepID=UPI000B29715C|nr:MULTISPECIES: site-specific integrase [Kineosporia]MCE0534457.1 site-specific integrase [Kineosporia rhizophila]GLY13991.1 putative prophage phiRv2 integrase [Kineosporia sp. NBRC 101677]